MAKVLVTALVLAAAMALGPARDTGPEHPVADTTPAVLASSPSTLFVSDPTASADSVPLYEKFELTFDVANTVATNLQFPYDPTPPPGLTGRDGISVEGLFLPPGETDWGKALHQPGFLYQGYQRQQINGAEWLYPKGDPVWKIRFAPTAHGKWQYRVRAQDGSTYPNWVESPVHSFIALPASRGDHGFVQVSKTDPRYFAFSDGTPFIGVGNYTAFSDVDFTYDADAKLATDAASGVDFVRTWMSRQDIAGSSWSPWAWFNGPWYGGYLPNPGLDNAPPGSGHDFTFSLDQSKGSTCIFNGWTQGKIPVTPDTTYRLSVTAMATGVTGPRNPANPNYGFTVKLGGWPDQCPDGLASSPNLVPYLRNGGWTTLDGTIETKANQNFLDFLYLVLDNASAGRADVSQVSLREVRPDGSLGPDILVKSNSDEQLDFNQKTSWDWDYLLDQAAQKGVYLKVVVLEKNDRVWNRINPDGTLGTSDSANNNFYAAPDTEVRRLQEYYWRYLAARWGYSTAVHSWELLNEGDPFNGNHYAAANAFARFIHQQDRNHLATTSFWHSYPVDRFWANPACSDVDYADIHAYAGTNNPVPMDPHDTAALHLALSQFVGRSPLGKPVVRGETGISGPSGEDPKLAEDKKGVWLHDFLWSQLDPGGVYELYWYTDSIVKNDLYFQFKPFRDFMAGIPLDNGHYKDALARASSDNVLVVGQSDTTNGRAHLWIENRGHTWWNVVNGASWGRLDGTVTVPGFAPNRSYPIEWWEFDGAGNLTVQRATAGADGSGNLTVDLSTLPDDVTDVALKIGQQ